jgi:hypothetical protein
MAPPGVTNGDVWDVVVCAVQIHFNVRHSTFHDAKVLLQVGTAGVRGSMQVGCMILVPVQEHNRLGSTNPLKHRTVLCPLVLYQ